MREIKKDQPVFSEKKMASIESRIDAFIAEHELDTEIKDEICALVTGCMEDLFKHVFKMPVPADTENKKAKKVLKSEKIEDPTSCESLEELRNCTTGVLNQFCKDHGLKIGGNKKEIMDRVWRHIQGESSDEDKSSRGKAKASKAVPEKHACAGTNVAGVPCGTSATEEFGGCHFCWRHINDAQKFIDVQNKTVASEPVAKSKAKASKAPKATEAEPAKKQKGKPKKPEPEPELVTETEDDNSEEEVDEE
jgi:hypothetical protein